MKLSDQQIKEIAHYLDIGMICYVHKQTGEIKPIYNLDFSLGDTEFWEKELKKIESSRKDYIEIEQMPSQKAFRIMEDFAEGVEDDEFKKRLIFALQKNKPFQNFKYELAYNEDIRQAWFEFKAVRYQQWVKREIEAILSINE